MQNTESFFNQSFFPMDKPLSAAASFDGNSEKYSKNDCDILVFSREKDTRLLLKTLLKLWKYQSEDSDCPRKFWRIIKNRQPKLIMIDDFLPFEENLQFIKQISQNEFSNKIPVILLSGFSGSRFRKISLDAGADYFFEKPLDFNLLEDYLINRIPRSLNKFEGRKLQEDI